MQNKQQEFQNSWNQEEQTNNDSEDDDGEGKDVEKRGLYAEYDIEPETENEKSQRAKGVGDTGELPGQEDVFHVHSMPHCQRIILIVIRNLQWL